MLRRPSLLRRYCSSRKRSATHSWGPACGGVMQTISKNVIIQINDSLPGITNLLRSHPGRDSSMFYLVITNQIAPFYLESSLKPSVRRSNLTANHNTVQHNTVLQRTVPPKQIASCPSGLPTYKKCHPAHLSERRRGGLNDLRGQPQRKSALRKSPG